MTTPLTPAEDFQLMLQCLSVALFFAWWFSHAKEDISLREDAKQIPVKYGGLKK
jgi:hypothetical protein